ncbi:glycosyltransferase family 4 protein [Bacillus sp. ISL-57]|uniref:glycosyltransferase family 4 protein n=1 Tax=Bacillus sp. ISL-57 TaxID=2819135 RepID=UPI001BE73A32|nr:glycosyltransferase family 4 protein [Bacillus sp. ISL-57]MBT2718161.1 glycosyltransferase family 4 protein [Bacillus sp. ISL-57]
MEKKVIVYVCEALGGGVRKHLVDLLDHIDKEKFDIHVIHGVNRMDSVFLNAINRIKNVNFYPIKEMDRSINIKLDFVALKKTIKILNDIKPDVVHCHSSKAGVIGRIAAKYLRIKQIYYTPHGYIIQDPKISNRKKLLFCWIEKILANKFTTKVVHVSKGEEFEAIKNRILTKKKSVVIYNGMSIPDEVDVGNQEGFNIVTIARMDDQKNPWEAIKIIEGLLKENPKIKYTYVGDGKFYKEIVEYVKSKGLDNNIILPGFMDRPYEVLKYADLFLLTSLYEGLPYALIEAMAFKVPLLASNVTGNNELTIDDYNGFLYNLNNIKEGKSKLNLLINDRNKLLKMSKNADQYFLDNFTIEKMIQSYDKLYSSF